MDMTRFTRRALVVCFVIYLFEGVAFALVDWPDPNDCPYQSPFRICMDGALWKPCHDQKDLNYDGKIDMVDLIWLHRWVMGMCRKQTWVGDLNNSGSSRRDAGDLLLMYKYLLKNNNE